VKYILADTKLPHELLDTQNGIMVYENKSVLPPAFMVDAVSVPFEGEDCFAIQNAILRAFGGWDVFHPLAASNEGMDYRFVTANDWPVYAYFATTWEGIYEALYVNGTRLEPYHTYHLGTKNAVYIGSFTPGTEVVISLVGGLKPLDAYIYYLDMDALADITARLKEGGLTDITYTASALNGNVYAREDGYLFISIPYDHGLSSIFRRLFDVFVPFAQGWIIKVDGERIEIERGLGAFMAVPVRAGNHQIEMTFRPDGLISGSLISLFTLAGVIYFARRKSLAKNM
jgi:hypothetical protein